MLFHWSFREPTWHNAMKRWHNAKRRNAEFHSRLWETTCFSSSRIFFFSSLKAVAWSFSQFSRLREKTSYRNSPPSSDRSWYLAFQRAPADARNQSCWPPKSPTRLTETAWKCSIYPLASTRNCNATSNIIQHQTPFHQLHTISMSPVLNLLLLLWAQVGTFVANHFGELLHLPELLWRVKKKNGIPCLMVSTIGIIIPPK